MILLNDILTGIVPSVILILIFLLYRDGSKKKLPPGPWGIPIFGVMPFLNKPPHIKFQEYFKKYGKLCSFYIGNKLVVIISDFELIKEAFVRQGEIFAGRPENIAFKVFPQDKGIAICEGNDFKQYKSFILSTLKDLGAVRLQFEAIVRYNAEHFIKYIKQTNEETVNILGPLGVSIAQTYNQLLLGNHLKQDEPTFKELVSLCYQEQRLYGNGARMCLPWAKKIPIISKYIGEDDIKKVRSRIYEILETALKENLDSYEEGSRQTFVHSWLTEDRKRKSINPNDNFFGRHALLHNLGIVFSAGYETTTTTLRWSFLFLLNHPEVQDKIIKELDEVVGNDRQPSLDDCSRLPYTMATIQETHRCATIGPLGLPHRTREATTLGGYFIPKSSYIFSNTLSVHTDPHLFPDPHKFKPDRFIDESGKFFKSEYVIPFSIGKRLCPGEMMAQTEIFIYLTYILQNFRLEKEMDKSITETDRSINFSATPNDFNLKFVNRKSHLIDN